jgi:hypothetical protein
MEDMSAPKLSKWIAAVLMCGTVGLACAKLPAAPVDPAKAEEAKKKAADAAKKGAEAMAKAQDRAVERYKKEKGGGTMAAKAASAAPKK